MPLTRPAVCECPIIITVPRFQFPGRRAPKPSVPTAESSVRVSRTTLAGRRFTVDAMITNGAIALLSERVTIPLQFERHLTRAIEEPYEIGRKPVRTEVS